MNVCKLWDAEYPWDVRAEKVARTLTCAGHQVHLLARNRDARPLEEQLPEAMVYRLAPLPHLGKSVSDASMFPFFFNPRWLTLIRRIALRTSADLLLCRDLPLAPAAIRIARSIGLPVVLDMAENYPAMIQAVWDAGRQRTVDWLVRNPALVKRVERWVIRRVDHILVVVEESRQRLIGLGVPADRISVVSNTPPLARVRPSPSRAHSAPPVVRLIYLGLLEAPRGLGVLIEAVAQCQAQGLPIHLTVVGDGRERCLFEDQARTLGLPRAAVSFLGRIPHPEAVSALESADVGVVPHLANDSWNTTIPNKLFDYMAAGLPVLTSDARPAARIVRDTGCGEVYRSDDPTALAQAIRRLLAPEVRSRYGRAGQEAIVREYHWERDASRLIAALEATRAESR